MNEDMHGVGAGTLRVGLAGAGWVSARHLEAWRACELAGVVAICDADRAKAESRGAEFGITRVFDGVEAMLDACELDCVDVATTPASHGAVTLAALRRGKAVLCQKPLAPTFAEARRIADAAAEAWATHPRARLAIHENWRFRPHYVRIRHWLDAGAIGSVRSVDVAVRSSGLVADADGALPAIVRQPLLSTLDRLMIGELLVHHLDVVCWLLGQPLSVLDATVGRRCLGVRGEDSARIVLGDDQGRPVARLAGTLVDPDAPPTPQDAVRVEGDCGSILLAGDRLMLAGAENEELALDPAAAYAESYRAAIAAFASALSSGARFPVEVDDHLAVLALVEQAYARAGAKADPTSSGAGRSLRDASTGEAGGRR